MFRQPHAQIFTHEIVTISEHAFWMFFDAREDFLPFERFPWFRNATVRQVSDIQLLHETYLYWPGPDVDLSFDIIEDPEKYKPTAKQKRQGNYLARPWFVSSTLPKVWTHHSADLRQDAGACRTGGGGMIQYLLS